MLTAETPSSINGAEYYTGAGQRGAGVTIDRIQRFNISYFDGRYRAVSSEAGNWETQSGILSQLESVLAETSADGLLPKLDQFWAGWQSLSNDPTNTSLRTVLLDDAASLATAFNRRATQMMQLRSGVPCASTGRQPIIMPLKPTAAISSGATPVRASSCRLVPHTASHQLSGSCSAQLGRG